MSFRIAGFGGSGSCPMVEADETRITSSLDLYQWNGGSPDVGEIMGASKFNRMALLSKYAVKASYEALSKAGLLSHSFPERGGFLLELRKARKKRSIGFMKELEKLISRKVIP